MAGPFVRPISISGCEVILEAAYPEAARALVARGISPLLSVECGQVEQRWSETTARVAVRQVRALKVLLLGAVSFARLGEAGLLVTARPDNSKDLGP